MASYQTQRDKIREFFLKQIYPKIPVTGIDYYQTISVVASELGTTQNMVEDVLRNLAQTGKIKELRIFELPAEETERRRKVELEANTEVKVAFDAKPLEK